jgi:Fe-Mn family superoxide dismutase
MSYELPALPYAFDALEPVIDAATVELHYTKHHAGYLKNLNAALENHPKLASQPVETLLSEINLIPINIRTSVRNNGGGYYNHMIYWSILSPTGGGQPGGALGKAIDAAFDGFENFKKKVESTGLARFGSGWVWLSKKTSGELVVHSTANQDTPLQENLLPILGFDVWEHAYYLKYQNRRADYLASLWQIVNWQEAEKRYTSVV